MKARSSVCAAFCCAYLGGEKKDNHSVTRAMRLKKGLGIAGFAGLQEVWMSAEDENPQNGAPKSDIL